MNEDTKVALLELLHLVEKLDKKINLIEEQCAHRKVSVRQ